MIFCYHFEIFRFPGFFLTSFANSVQNVTLGSRSKMKQSLFSLVILAAISTAMAAPDASDDYQSYSSLNYGSNGGTGLGPITYLEGTGAAFSWPDPVPVLIRQATKSPWESLLVEALATARRPSVR